MVDWSLLIFLEAENSVQVQNPTSAAQVYQSWLFTSATQVYQSWLFL